MLLACAYKYVNRQCESTYILATGKLANADHAAYYISGHLYVHNMSCNVIVQRL